MKILYHLTIPPPVMPQCEAVWQEIELLKGQFGGDLVYLNPSGRFPFCLPRVLFGFQKLRQLWVWERELDVHHLYNPDPFPFPVLRRLRRPLVYSLSAGVGNERPNMAFFASLAAVTVSDERSLGRLQAWGLDNSFLVRSGVDTTRFAHSPLPLRSEMRLMVGSAPWTRAQFRTKGVEALLLAAQCTPRLRLVFLWRGVLADEMERRVRRMNLEQQVTVLNEQVDVNQVLANVHASIALATDSSIVKSYPHSLMESLAAGKPVLVSRAIPMSDYVERTGCGKVVENMSPAAILTAIEGLRSRYHVLQESAQRVGQRDFSQQELIESFRQVYDRVV